MTDVAVMQAGSAQKDWPGGGGGAVHPEGVTVEVTVGQPDVRIVVAMLLVVTVVGPVLVTLVDGQVSKAVA